MDLKSITKESNNLSEELFIKHNISDVRTKRLVKEYFYNKVYQRELLKELGNGEQKQGDCKNI